MRFPYFNVEFKKNYGSDLILVSGEIRNYSGKSYNTAAYKIILYRKSKILSTGIIKVYDFKAHFTRAFEAVLDINYKMIPKITGFDIVFESGF